MMPHDVWSFLDIMALLENQAIFRGLVAASQLDTKWALERAAKQPFLAEQFEFYVETFSKMTTALEEAHLPISARYARDILKGLDTTDNEDGRRIAQGRSLALLSENIGKLVKVLPDEADTRLFVPIPSELSYLYESTRPPFGEAVERVFSIAIDDIRDAGNCLALGQGTATVFHLMRVLEAGLRGLAKQLNVTYAPTWDGFLGSGPIKLLA